MYTIDSPSTLIKYDFLFQNSRFFFVVHNIVFIVIDKLFVFGFLLLLYLWITIFGNFSNY